MSRGKSQKNNRAQRLLLSTIGVMVVGLAGGYVISLVFPLSHTTNHGDRHRELKRGQALFGNLFSASVDNHYRVNNEGRAFDTNCEFIKDEGSYQEVSEKLGYPPIYRCVKARFSDEIYCSWESGANGETRIKSATVLDIMDEHRIWLEELDATPFSQSLYVFGGGEQCGMSIGDEGIGARLLPLCDEDDVIAIFNAQEKSVIYANRWY